MKEKKILWFLIGALCFTLSQPVIRLPLLQYLQNTTGFILRYTLNPLLIGILIAFSAGLFEEGFRCLFKQFILKPSSCKISQPIVFGLGHGIAEALFILIPALLQVPLSQLGLAFLERFLAVILHVNLTVIVWNGFQRKQRIIYLAIAITVHGLVNSMIPLLSSLLKSAVWIEALLAFIDLILIGYSFYSRKYYIKE